MTREISPKIFANLYISDAFRAFIAYSIITCMPNRADVDLPFLRAVSHRPIIGTSADNYANDDGAETSDFEGSCAARDGNQGYSPPSDNAWTILGSALLPSRNSSSVSLSSWFLSIWSKILSTLFCGVFSSSACGCCPTI